MARVIGTLRILLLSLTAVWLAGCYSYAPLQGPPSGVERGTRLKIHLSRPVDVRMGDVGANNVVYLDAEMIDVEGDSLAVSVFQTTSQSGYQQEVNGRTGKVPLDAVGSIELRTFSAVKTLAAGALVVAAALGAAAALTSGFSGSSGSGNTGQTGK